MVDEETRTPDEEHPDEPATFSQSEQITLAVGSIWTRLVMQLNESRELLQAADERDRRPTSRPADLQHLGRVIDGARTRKAEQAVEEVLMAIEDHLHELFSPAGEVVESADARGKKSYPPAPEQLVVMAIIGLGPARYRQVVASLVSACNDDRDTMGYALRYLQWKRRGPLTAIVGKALLPGIVADLEELVAALLRLWMTLYPQAEGVDQKQVTVGDVASYASSDDILRRAIDEKVGDLVDGGPLKWQPMLSRGLKIDVEKLATDWPGLLEVFARRHAVVHAGGLVDERYLDRLADRPARPDLGTSLVCDTEYTSQALGIVEQFGTALCVAWLAHFLSGDPNVAEFASEPVLRALQQQRWRDAKTLAELALSHCDAEHPHHEVQVNCWMARRELGEDWLALRADIEAWEPPAGEPRYRVARAALLHDEAGVRDALLEYDRAGLSVRDLATWPLLVERKKHSPRVAALVAQRSAKPHAQRPPVPRRRKRRKG